MRLSSTRGSSVVLREEVRVGRKMLIAMFRLNGFVIEGSLEGLTEEESLQSPAGGGNCVNWVMGHIAATRNPVLRLAREDAALPEEEAQRYARGSAPIRSAEEALSLGRLLRCFRDSQERLLTALGRLTEEDLAQRGFDKGIGGESVGEQLAGFAFHEAYHAGQLGLHRRLLGREGVVR
jgi:uncharacterized damage-inducible protein DinB